jgi:hypothetical protein
MSESRQLPRKKEKAVAALLASATIERAAEQVGVCEKTMRNWLADAAFAAAYREARRQIVEHAVTLLQRTTGVAVATLARNLNCGRPAIEVSAASAILTHALGAVELFDLAGRVAELEEKLAGGMSHANGYPATNGEASR